MRQFEKFQVSDLDSYFEEAYVGRTQSCFSRMEIPVGTLLDLLVCSE